MPKLELPALDPASVEARSATIYPDPFRACVAGRAKRKLGDACKLTRMGVNETTLQPGARSALRHWHTLEDEFVYVLEGELVLVTNRGEQRLTRGMCAGFPGGARDAHHLVNRSGAPATYLEIGNRIDGDNAFYPDDDLLWVETEGGTIAAHKDGTHYER